MGAKTRGNYTTGGWCGKADCANRGKRCEACVRWSAYTPEKPSKRPKD